MCTQTPCSPLHPQCFASSARTVLGAVLDPLQHWSAAGAAAEQPEQYLVTPLALEPSDNNGWWTKPQYRNRGELIRECLKITYLLVHLLYVFHSLTCYSGINRLTKCSGCKIASYINKKNKSGAKLTPHTFIKVDKTTSQKKPTQSKDTPTSG